MQMRWLENEGGIFVAEVADLRLMVHSPNRLHARFTVSRSNHAGGRTLVGSGVLPDCKKAIAAAEAMATRLRACKTFSRLLVITADDNARRREAIAYTLRDADYDVTEATSGEGALRRIERSSRPIVLVTDMLSAGGISGEDLAMMVHKLRPTVGILLITDIPPRKKPSWRWDCLTRPFSTQALTDRVGSLAETALNGNHLI